MTPRKSTLDLLLSVLLALPFSIVFVGRVLPGLVAEPLKADLHLSDSQLGLLTGLIFGIVYFFAALPMGRIADRVDRSRLMTGLLVVFAATTACGGLTAGFLTLLLSRTLVGVCESGVFSPSITLLADKVAPERRPWAMAVYMAGQVFGYSAFVLVVGVAADRYGWRGGFFAVACLTLVVAAALKISVSDVRTPAAATEPASLPVVLRTLRSKHSFVHLAIGMTLYLVVDAAASNWIPAFLSRSFGRDLVTTSGFMALGTGVLNGAVVFAAGPVLSRLRRRSVRYPVLAIIVATLVSTSGYLIGFCSSVPALSMGALLVAMSMSSLIAAPLFSSVQELTRAEYRTTALAIAVTPGMLLGAGGGPQLVGVVSDWLSGRFGNESLRWSLAGLAAVCGTWVLLHYGLALRYIERETEEESLGATTASAPTDIAASRQAGLA